MTLTLVKRSGVYLNDCHPQGLPTDWHMLPDSRAANYIMCAGVVQCMASHLM